MSVEHGRRLDARRRKDELRATSERSSPWRDHRRDRREAEEAAAAPSVADVQQSVGNMKVAMDTMWVMLTAFLVFFMQAGFGFLEAGFVRSKNVVNIMAENLMDTTMTTVGFIIAGFALMFWGAGHAWWLTVLLLPVTALFFVRTFIIMHDCSHGSFTASRRANDESPVLPR